MLKRILAFHAKRCRFARKQQRRNLRFKSKVLDDSIVASLNAIEDNMGTLGVNYDDPKIESIIQPDEKATREDLFKKIMAE